MTKRRCRENQAGTYSNQTLKSSILSAILAATELWLKQHSLPWGRSWFCYKKFPRKKKSHSSQTICSFLAISGVREMCKWFFLEKN